MDEAGDVIDWRSITGYCIYFDNNPIIWSANKQSTV